MDEHVQKIDLSTLQPVGKKQDAVIVADAKGRGAIVEPMGEDPFIMDSAFYVFRREEEVIIRRAYFTAADKLLLRAPGEEDIHTAIPGGEWKPTGRIVSSYHCPRRIINAMAGHEKAGGSMLDFDINDY